MSGRTDRREQHGVPDGLRPFLDAIAGLLAESVLRELRADPPAATPVSSNSNAVTICR